MAAKPILKVTEGTSCDGLTDEMTFSLTDEGEDFLRDTIIEEMRSALEQSGLISNGLILTEQERKLIKFLRAMAGEE